MDRFETKFEKISHLEQLLLQHPLGLCQAEIARKIGVHRSTVNRYMTELEHILPLYEENGKILIQRDQYLHNIKLSIHELMVLYLAVRLYSSRMDKHNPHACSALRKLGNSVTSYSKRLSDFICATASNIEKDRNIKGNFVKILEAVTRAWSDCRWLQISYHSRSSNENHEYCFAPYFVQPYAVGYSIYSVGFCREKDRIITLKLERICSASLLEEKYEIPESFCPADLFADAWGIWYSDKDPIEVTLEFSGIVADRVLETVWHKNQTTQKTKSGSLIWKASIAEPLEMLPWIRGWGKDVEVKKPESLRDMMKEEVRKMTVMYG